MNWPVPVQTGLFLKRYKRFFADFILLSELPERARDAVKLDSKKFIESNPEFKKAKVHVAHVANTGSLKSVLRDSIPCLVSPAQDPLRKLRWNLEALQAPDESWIGVNTSWPNKLAEEIFAQKLLKNWVSFDSLQREVKINSETRLDLCLQSSKTSKKHFVEIKNVTLKIENSLAFPDGVSERALKHVNELLLLLEQGHGAEILFICQRSDARSFRPAQEFDPEYAKALKSAVQKGVLITALEARVSPGGIEIMKSPLEVIL